MKTKVLGYKLTETIYHYEDEPEVKFRKWMTKKVCGKQEWALLSSCQLIGDKTIDPLTVHRRLGKGKGRQSEYYVAGLITDFYEVVFKDTGDKINPWQKQEESA